METFSESPGDAQARRICSMRYHPGDSATSLKADLGGKPECAD